ncbi:MAG: cupin [Ferrovibrionaceae bacterium]
MTPNLFSDLAFPLDDEQVDLLHAAPGLKIERIVSSGQASPPGFWYDQPQDVWVVVLACAARLRLEGEADARLMRAGDHVFLPAHRRHRVDWTDPDQPTIWLAVHSGAVS